MQHQEHFGRKFYLDKTTGYWISTDYPRIRAHVWVWIYHFGEPGDGYHIHHIDGDKSNNNIANLQKLTEFDHLSLHMTEEKKKWASQNMREVVRPAADIWHGSEEGLLWHRKHAKEMSFGHWDLKEINCQECGTQVKPKVKHQKFCHANCKAKYGRRKVRENKRDS